MNNHDMKNLNQSEAEVVKRGYTIKTPELPALKRGSAIATGITSSWFEGIQQTAGQYKDDYSILNARQAHRVITDGLDALDNLRQKKNPADTASTHLSKIESSAKKLTSTAVDKIDNARNEIKARKAKLKTEMQERLGLNTTSQQSEEIRSILRNMNEKDRSKVIADAIESGDKTILSSLWTAHPISVGMDGKLLESFKVRATRKHCADLVAFEESLNRTDSLLDETFVQMMDGLSNAAGDPKTRKQFETDAAEAEAAQMAFVASLRGE